MRKNAPINTPKIMEAFYTKDPNLFQNTSPGVNSSKRAPDDTLTEKEKNNNLSEIPSFDPVIASKGDGGKFSKSNNKSDGTIGTKGLDNGPYAPNALSLQTIDNLTSQAMKTAIDPNFLRERVVKIALSYIGIDELPGDNVGWHDKIFQNKMESLTKKWYKTPGNDNTGKWCNYFTNLVWQEAYYKGNALVGANTDPVSVNTYNTVLNKIGGSKKTKTHFYFSGGTSSTRNGFKRAFNGKYFISKSEAKNGFKSGKIPQPGDLVLFNGHIAILYKINIKNNKLVSYETIDGNSSANDWRDGGSCRIVKNRKINSKLLGFGMLQREYTK